MILNFQEIEAYYWLCVLVCILLVMGIQQRTSLDFESRSSIKKIQRLCL
ncbi:hypothetical protein T10_2294 [Trichinella papuae]|uniref:Uncharacterized protein n=1 Tax=Trichinella papuae TaxID=268474 RepID=A0A0V1LYM0_9BILA|nr:hypothetical protein T10_2294 [Trichinella papuae]